MRSKRNFKTSWKNSDDSWLWIYAPLYCCEKVLRLFSPSRNPQGTMQLR